MAEPMCGGISSQLSEDDMKRAVDLLNTSLENLSKGDGPSLKLVKVKSVTSQVVAGVLYRYTVDICQDDTVKEGHVEIWHRVWLEKDGTRITIKFENDENVIESTF
ncbi:CG8066 [Drosophila busckii]|uniref:CG8066 n=1 Tax=Drosophila busckii TaxID=30019 RepID=A0A0M4ENF7_DROBS|nr:cystatin-like protein [Drosophila busckii]ALC45435.1 CG8066 [Drosophila busckii]